MDKESIDKGRDHEAQETEHPPDEGTVQGWQRITAQDGYTQVIDLFASLPVLISACPVAHRAGNDRDLVAKLPEMSGQFMVTCAAGFIQRCKGLVDQQNMHVVNILLEYWVGVFEVEKGIRP